MHGADQSIRTVIVQHKVVNPVYIFKFGDRGFDFLRNLAFRTLTEHLREAVAQHFKAGFDDDKGNHRAEPRFKAESPQKEDRRGDQSRGGDD